MRSELVEALSGEAVEVGVRETLDPGDGFRASGSCDCGGDCDGTSDGGIVSKGLVCAVGGLSDG